jgi:hypothetical protein
VWAQWCRDPLLTLGVCDPVDRIEGIQAADPKRKHVVAVFDIWWDVYAGKPVLVKDIDDCELIRAIDQRARTFGGEFQYSRQFVARWLADHAGSRVGGYVLVAESIGPPSKPVHRYRLEKGAED